MTARTTVGLGPLELELGGRLPSISLAYESWGTPRRDPAGQVTNAVLVLHALTGDAHVVGPAGPDQPTPGWWNALVGPGRALDTDRWFVVAANVLGGCRGSTGPATPAADGRRYGSRFPEITVRDQVHAERRLADALGIERFAAVIGASMGGMRALEWPLMFPDRVGAALVVAVGAAASADQIATQSTQQLAITSDPAWQNGDYTAPGPVAGLGLARRIAQLTYRTENELATRFGRDVQDDGRFAVVSYLDHHGDKLVARFDAGSYVTLTQAMNTHDIGRGRGGVAAALRSVGVPMIVAGVDTDRLYPLYQQQEIADLVSTSDGLHVIHSPYGHDGFLIEADQVAELVLLTLARSTASRAA